MEISPEPETPVVTFTLRNADFLAFQRRMRRLTVLSALQIGYRWISVPSAFVLIAYNSTLINGSLTNAIIAWLLIAAVWIGYCVFSGRASLLNVSTVHAGSKQPRTVQLTSDGLVVKTIATQARYDWLALHRADTDQHRLYLYTSPTTALIIRRDAFPGPSAADEFLRAASRYAVIARQSARFSQESLPAWDTLDDTPPGQRIRFTLSPEEMYRFYGIVGKWEMVRAILAVTVICGMFISLIHWIDHMDMVTGFGLEMVYLLFLIGLVVWQTDRARRKKGASRVQNDQILIVTADGVEQRLQHYVSITPWAKIQELRETPQLYLLFMAPQHAFVIPKRAFGSAEEARVFFQTAQTFRQAALTGIDAPPVEQVASWPPPPRR